MSALVFSSPAAATLPPMGSPQSRQRCHVASASSLCGGEAGPTIDLGSVSIREGRSDEELWAAVRLRARTFFEFNHWYYNEDYKQYMMKREFEALKDRIGGKRKGFKRVCCINASILLSPYLVSANGLSSLCKYSDNGEDQLVVGTLDLNQCLRLANELAGKLPEDAESNDTRAYLTNVCVAAELQRNGLGYTLIADSKKIAREWGITHLYVHVAVDNEAALKLYQKTGFLYEDKEPIWHAKLLDRPPRYLLGADLQANYKIQEHHINTYYMLWMKPHKMYVYICIHSIVFV